MIDIIYVIYTYSTCLTCPTYIKCTLITRFLHFCLFILRLQLPSSLVVHVVLSWYCFRYVWYLGIHEMSALSPPNPGQSATMSSPRHHQETPRHAQIPPNLPKSAPVSPPCRTHLYPFVSYSTVQHKLKPVHLPHYQIYHLSTNQTTTKTTTRTTSLYQPNYTRQHLTKSSNPHSLMILR